MTEGYTTQKRNLHVITCLILVVLGAVLLLAKYYGSTRTNHYTVLVIGILLILTGGLALIPILGKPVVDAEICC
jgi:cytochrome b subunit of formate dehydrogenase